MNITTAEAALRLGLSEATVKRRLSEGKLPGQKVGSRWVVHGEQLPSPQRSAPEQSSVGALDVARAFSQVRANDRRDLWVPDIVNWADYSKDPSAVIARAIAKVSTDSPIADQITYVEVPKGAYLTRAGALLSIEDRVAYQALCNELALDADSRLTDRVFSSRVIKNPKRHDFIASNARQWRKFLEATKETQAQRGPWVVSTDLVSYFDSISHRLLFSALEGLRGHERTVRILRRLMDQWRGDSHHGLPTGPEASRFLGNFFLVGIDAFMIGRGFEYFRYMDDVRIVASSKEEALLGLRLFEVECRKLGLVVSSAKTTVTDELQATFDPVLDQMDYFFQRRIDESRKVLRDLLKQTLKEDRPKVKHAKFALLRLAALVDAPALKPVMERLEQLQEAAPESAVYLRAFISDGKVQEALSEYLQKRPEPLLEGYQQAWLLAAMLEVQNGVPDDWASYALGIADDQNQPTYLRILALNLVAKRGRREDVERIRLEIRSSYDPAVLRGAIVALARAGYWDKEMVDIVKARAPQLSATLDYLKGRDSLPSLVQEGLWSSVRS